MKIKIIDFRKNILGDALFFGSIEEGQFLPLLKKLNDDLKLESYDLSEFKLDFAKNDLIQPFYITIYEDFIEVNRQRYSQFYGKIGKHILIETKIRQYFGILDGFDGRYIKMTLSLKSCPIEMLIEDVVKYSFWSKE